MHVLVLGSGGREHALAWKINQSPLCSQLTVAPGNGGTALFAHNIDVDPSDKGAVVEFAKTHAVDLVVIGPEGPLVAGVADALREADILAFGPGSDGAQIEGSKEFAKEFMKKYEIPTASYESFDALGRALAYVEDHELPLVVKADGLAAGKGVTIAHTLEEARAAVVDCLIGRFGEAGRKVVIESYLEGPECSLLCFVSGPNMIPLVAARDYKRIGDNDEGPNTGGMGAVSPIPDLYEDDYVQMVTYMQKAVEGLQEEGIDYRGVLYGGFMLTSNGPMVLEYNARFGDPETQVLMARLEDDILELMLEVARGELDERELSWTDDYALTVVMASGGYPVAYEVGYPIENLHETEDDKLVVFHAGTKLDEGGSIITDGGRVLNVTARGETFEDARKLAYEATKTINFKDEYYRMDIGE